jgi:hypothetical protein
VIRIVWIAAFCLAGLGGLFATRVTASISEEAVRDPATVGTSLVRDTLAKADKLDVGYFRYPVESTPVPAAEPIAAEIQPSKAFQPTKAFQPIKAWATAKAGSSHAPDLSVHRIAVLLPKPRPKIKPTRNAKDVGLAKAALDLKTCHQQDGLAGLLISLNGSPRCEL